MCIHRIPLVLAGLLLLTLNLKAGRLDQQLADKISAAKPEEQISILIEMADQVDMPGLKAELKAKKANLAETHKRVIESLQEKADRSQKDLINYLTAAKNSGRITDFRPFWISSLIWVKAPRSEIETIAKRKDVEVVFLTPKVEIVEPVQVDVLGTQSALVGVEPGLRMIHAPQVWGLGFRGKGRLVCNIDTGVDKNHGTLSARWRGNFLTADPAILKQAWYDPIYNTTVPNDNKAGGSAGHGTGTMGVICGCNPATGDTIGVAIEAQWIAAQAIDINADWPVEIGGLQWSADPDGDPNTLGDVPDVVNNSWGLPKYTTSCGLVPGYTPCWEIYWQVLDNVAAAGPVVVFAAGNEGTCGGGVSNLRVPADRIASDYNVFAVGSVDNDSVTVSSFSSRGPSPCDNVTKKPEVVAPGVSVRSAYPGTFALWSGTSFSAPHVAGAAALLKQINPNATSAQILHSLYVTARDISTPGEDNNSGRGVINVLAAKDSLPALADPHIFIMEHEFLANPAPDPGEQMTFNPTLVNDGNNAYGVKLTLQSNSGLATVTDSISIFGNMPKNDTAFSLDFTVFTVSPSAQPGDKLPFTLKVSDDSGYLANYPLLFYVTAKPLQSKANHDKGNFILTISNFGQYGFGTSSVNHGIAPDTGVGFIYPKAGSDNLFEAAVLFGLPTAQVSDAARDYVGFLPDSDFVVAPGGELVLDTLSSGRKSDQDGFGIFTDERAESPIGLRVVQRSYVFSDTANDDYVIFEYTIHNESGSALSGLRAGFFTDFDFGGGFSDRAGFVRSKNLGYMFQNPGSNYRGIVVTDTLGITSYRAIENADATFGIYNGFEDIKKWQYMSGGFADTANATVQDGSILAAAGPFNIPAGDSVKTSFALVGAGDTTSLKLFAQRAIDKYQTYLMCVAVPGDVNASGGITLGDIVHLVNYLFDKDRLPCLGSDPGNCWTPDPFCRGDVNASASITIGDVVHLVNYVFDKDRLPCLGSAPGNCWTPDKSSVCCQ